MKKIKLFLDFDGVITDSMDAACQTYNHLYESFDGFIPAEAGKCLRYDMLDVCPLCNGNPAMLFAEQYFFDVLKFTQDDVAKHLEIISENYDIIVTSIGTAKNVSKKVAWIKENLPMIEKNIMLTGRFIDKSSVNMAGGVIVDDVSENLANCNAAYRITFGKVFPWNAWRLCDIRARDFVDLRDILEQYYKIS